jgi:hypothetical protein
MSNSSRMHVRPLPYEPTSAEVEALISAAAQHPLGLEYLRDGSLESVAVMFRAHAFTVVAARDRLARSES